MNGHDNAALESVLAQAERRIAALEAKLAKMESSAVASPVLDEVSSRRGLFKLAGAVATGAVATTLASASPAAASTTGPYVGLGQAENTSADTSITRSGAGGAAFIGTSTASGVTDGLKGVANSPTAAGVEGESSTGFGVYGTSSTGYSLFAGGSGRIGMAAHLTSEGPPTTGSYAVGDIISASNGALWACTTSGTPGQWVRMSERATSNTLPTGITTLFKQVPRDYLSLSAGPIVPGAPRTVKLTSLPSGAKGAIISVTIVSPTAWAAAFPTTGYISIIAGGGTFFVPSVGFIPGTLQNTGLVVTAVDSQQQVTMATFGAGGCHVILDILGYMA
jgi:hypothetical protein